MKHRLLFLLLTFASVALYAQQPKPLVITDETHFVKLPSEVYWVSELEDGAWTVMNGNTFGFFLEDGRKLFDFDWGKNGNRDPQMLEGAVIMYKKDETYNKPQYILYLDGSVKELPADWTGPATNFVDGVALIGKKNGSKLDYIYINVNGERVYGDLVSIPNRFDNKDWTVPPLKDGMRAYSQVNPSGFGSKWGYINDKGKVVIPARFDKCRSFSEGYALVQEGQDIYFIDKTGQKVLTPEIVQYETYFNDISDVKEGLFIIDGSKRKYYNMKGEKVFEAGKGTSFYDGYAIHEDPETFQKWSIVVDRDFNVVRYIPFIESPWDDFGFYPNFEKLGIATVNRDRVITPDGTTLIQHPAISKKYPNSYQIGDFTSSGYAKAYLDHNRVRYHGFINQEGEFVIIYDWDHDVTAITPDPNNPIRIPKDSLISILPDTLIKITPEDPKPIGPKTTHRMEYTVSVTGSPAEGGTVRGAGKYHLGDNVPLGATPKEGWKVSGWECTTPGYYNSKLPAGVTINGRDLAFVAKFTKIPEKDSIEEVSNTGHYVAHQDGMTKSDVAISFDVYMEMSAAKDIESPYGKETYGFLTCMLDGNHTYTVEQLVNGKPGSLSFKMFFVPMKISGIIKENDGKRYLVLDGGQYLCSDVQLNCDDPLAALYINSIMNSEGTFGTVSTGRYRLELTEYDENTGECTFGELYRFHPDLGWVVAENFPKKTKNTFYGSKSVDNSIIGDLFKGLKMKLCEKKAVEFAPPQGWVKEGYDDITAKLFQQMRSLTTDWDLYFSK
ncbi:MAG: WG repeat-containing protein [Bacteroidales bacterium]|nr:WG repeat-containing protein [Bacteroidales bacterium]